MKADQNRSIILGGGPSGLMVAKTLAERNIRTLIIDFPNLSLQTFLPGTQAFKHQHRSELGGNCKYWGGQVAYMTELDLQLFVNLAGLDIEQLAKIKNEMEQLSTEISLPFDINNKYHEIIDESSFLNIETFYSTYVNNLNILELLEINHFLENDMIAIQRAEVLGIEIEDGYCSKIILKDMDNLVVQRNTPVCVALGTTKSTELLVSVPEICQNFKRYSPSDHPHGYVAAFTCEKKNAFYRSPVVNARGQKFKRKFLLDSDVSETKGLVELHYDYNGSFFPDFVAIDSSLIKSVRSLVNRILLRLTGRARSYPEIFWAWVQVEKTRDFLSNTVEANSLESKGRLNSLDIGNIVSIQEKFISLMNASGFQLLWKAEVNDICNFFSDAFHPSGTLESIEKTNQRVAESFGKVGRVENLFVSSACTWPVSSWTNPTFMLMVFARLIGREILAFLKKA